ncbi:MAG: hypothetical protein J1E78_03065 [Muribaculaceae bacterium]|nr:hypothetical protein [Muribaculaceae bacterium]
MYKVIFSDIIKESFPDLKILQIEADVTNSETSDDLWSELLDTSQELKERFSLQELNKRPSIDATRKAYKKLGKDPNRYRPSAEALGRRIINDKGIYRLSSLIDIINLVSIKTGYSIGGFDISKISGDTLVLDRGRSDDIFHGIGRGPLNIEGLPVYRDTEGGIGTPTSDEERTKIIPSTTKLLLLVNVYGEEISIDETEKMIKDLLIRYASLENYSSKVLTPKERSEET